MIKKFDFKIQLKEKGRIQNILYATVTTIKICILVEKD